MSANSKSLLIGVLVIIALALGCSDDNGGAPVDKTPPTVLASFPQSGATEVTRSGPYWIAFSEAMDEESVEGALSAEPSFDFTTFWSGDTIFVAPDILLLPATTYTISVGTSANDLAGNTLEEIYEITFTTTSEVDTTRPTIVMTQPEDGASGIPSGMPIVITFSEPMTRYTIEGAISIEPSVQLEITVEASIVTIGHEGFPPDSLIKVTIDTTAADLAGNHLASEYPFSFRTAPDLIRPYLASASPAKGATGVSTNLSKIVLTFSEPMDPYSFDDFPIEDLDARLMHLFLEEPEFEPPYSTITLPIGEPLLSGCTYWVILRNVTDAAGNLIDPSPTHYYFTTRGSLTYFPVTYPNWWEYSEPWGGAIETFRIENYSPSTGDLDYARYDEGGIRRHVESLQLSGSTIYIRGVTDYTQDGTWDFAMTFDDPLPYIPADPHLRLGDTWQVQTTGTANTQTGSYDLTVSGTGQIEPDTTQIAVERLGGSFRNCAVVHLYTTLLAYSGTDTLGVMDSHIITYLAPGVGIVKRIQIDLSEGDSDTTVISDWGAD